MFKWCIHILYLWWLDLSVNLFVCLFVCYQIIVLGCFPVDRDMMKTLKWSFNTNDEHQPEDMRGQGKSIFLAISAQLSSIQFSCSVVSNSLWHHELQHARPPCPSLTSGVHPNPCPLSRWCHPTISPSVVPFSSCPNPSQNQGLFQWISSLHQVAKVLEFRLQHQSFQWTPRTDLL